MARGDAGEDDNREVEEERPRMAVARGGAGARPRMEDATSMRNGRGWSRRKEALARTTNAASMRNARGERRNGRGGG
jgi:hypothetical protein